MKYIDGVLGACEDNNHTNTNTTRAAPPLRIARSL